MDCVYCKTAVDFAVMDYFVLGTGPEYQGPGVTHALCMLAGTERIGKIRMELIEEELRADAR